MYALCYVLCSVVHCSALQCVVSSSGTTQHTADQFRSHSRTKPVGAPPAERAVSQDRDLQSGEGGGSGTGTGNKNMLKNSSLTSPLLTTSHRCEQLLSVQNIDNAFFGLQHMCSDRAEVGATRHAAKQTVEKCSCCTSIITTYQPEPTRYTVCLFVSLTRIIYSTLCTRLHLDRLGPC